MTFAVDNEAQKDIIRDQIRLLRHEILVVLQCERRAMRPDEIASRMTTASERHTGPSISRIANAFPRYFECERAAESRKIYLIQPHRHLRTW